MVSAMTRPAGLRILEGMERRYTSGDQTSTKQVGGTCECADFWVLWQDAGPLLKREPAHIRLPGRSRPVVMAEPVAIEDAVESAVRLVEHWRQVARLAPSWRGLEQLKRHVAPWPELQNCLPDVTKAIQAQDRDWLRRRTRAAEEVLAGLLAWDRKTVQRRQGDYDNFLEVDLRLDTCEDCRRDIFRRRSEPAALLLCALCRERRRSDFYLRLEGWLPASGGS
jgi:hypothetical protein